MVILKRTILSILLLGNKIPQVRLRRFAVSLRMCLGEEFVRGSLFFTTQNGWKSFLSINFRVI